MVTYFEKYLKTMVYGEIWNPTAPFKNTHFSKEKQDEKDIIGENTNKGTDHWHDWELKFTR